MISFNQLLRTAGIDLARARLVRHQDNRALAGRSPYDLWIGTMVDLSCINESKERIASRVRTGSFPSWQLH